MAPPNTTPTALDEDVQLARSILHGDQRAGSAFASRFRDSLITWLTSKCDPNDGRSREKASELVDALVAECVAGDLGKGKPPLLEKYSGRGSLEGWLRRSVRCRLISWWRSLEYRSEQTESSLTEDEEDRTPLIEGRFAAPEGRDSEPAIAEVLRDALLYGFSRAESEEPLGLVFLRLASLYGVQKQRLARAWDRDPAQAGRRISKALDLIRSEAQEYVHSVDPYLRMEWEDYLEVFEKFPRLLHGDESA